MGFWTNIYSYIKHLKVYRNGIETANPKCTRTEVNYFYRGGSKFIAMNYM